MALLAWVRPCFMGIAVIGSFPHRLSKVREKVAIK
jgi:hypothetical protein